MDRMVTSGPSPGYEPVASVALRRTPGANLSRSLAGLQRVAGNKAVTALVQRACCGRCATGRSCDSEADDKTEASPAAVVDEEAAPGDSRSATSLQRYAACTKARLSLKDCPDREPGEVDRAKTGPMVVGDITDRLDSGDTGIVIMNFAVGMSKLKPNFATDLMWKQFVKKLETSTTKWKLLGFSDCSGNEGLNAKLRKARARAVLDALAPKVRARVTAVEGAPLHSCIRENDNAGERTMNRSVAMILVESTYAFPAQPIKDSFKRKEPRNQSCSAQQRADLALAFPLAPELIKRAQAAINGMTRGSPEEALLKKFFGPDAFKYRHKINQGYEATLRAVTNGNYKCVPQGTAPCTGSTVGYAGPGSFIYGGPIVVCGGAFNGANTDRLELADTLIHEASHVGDWTNDHQYCSPTKGCTLKTTDQFLPGIGVTDSGALNNADSYSRFARAQL